MVMTFKCTFKLLIVPSNNFVSVTFYILQLLSWNNFSKRFSLGCVWAKVHLALGAESLRCGVTLKPCYILIYVTVGDTSSVIYRQWAGNYSLGPKVFTL